MKNIVLAGIPRSGKTTFLKMIKSEFPNYNIVDSDAFMSACIKANKVNKENCITTITMEKEKWDKILNNYFKYSIEYLGNHFNFILDTSHIDVNQLLEYKKSGYIVLVFGYPNISFEQKVNEILTYDTEDDWTYIESVKSIERYVDIYIDDSKELLETCQKENLRFVDTSFNREEVLKKLLNEIKKEIN